MIRLILVAISLVLFFIFSVILWPIEWVIGKFSPDARDISRFRIVQGYLYLLMFLSGIRLTVIGKEKVPTDRPVLYVLNHRSVFDIVVSLAHCPGRTGYIAKKEFEKVPLLSWWIRWINGLFLNRDDVREALKTILTAIDHIKGGISMAIYPEGTRNRDTDETKMLPFHEGSFKIASKTGCPVVPVVINHASEVFEDHFPWIKGTHIIMEYLDPVDIKALTGEDKKFPGRYVQGLMQEVLIRNHSL